MRATLAFVMCLAFHGWPADVHAGFWTPVGPIDGDYSVATHPTSAGHAMIGGGHGSISTWFSADGGSSWSGNPWRGATGRPILAGTPIVAWMPRDPQLLRSTDRGRSWAIVDFPSPTGSLRGLAVNPVFPDEVVVGDDLGLRHTLDGGRTWQVDTAAGGMIMLAVDWSTRHVYVKNFSSPQVPNPSLRRRSLDAQGGWSVVIDEFASVAAARGVILAAQQRSDDGGATFEPVNTPIAYDESSVVFAPDAALPAKRVYALVSEAGTYRLIRSDDDGASWSPMATLPALFPTEATLAVDALDANRVFVAAGEGVLVSSNGGASFQPIPRTSGAPAGTQMLVLDAIDPARQWTMAPSDFATMGIPRSVDGGQTWTDVAPERALLGASRTRTNTLFGSNRFLGGGGFGVSRDGGVTWVFGDPGGYSWYGPVGHGALPGEVFVAARGFDAVTNDEKLAVFVSTDDAESFIERPAPPLLLRAFGASASAPTILYAGGAAQVPGNPQLWRSTDRSLSWQPVRHFPHPWLPGPGNGNDIVTIAVDPIDANRLYVGLALPDHLMRSVDGGATWTRATLGLGAGAVTSIAIDPANPAILYAGQHGSGVFRSTDHGQTWTALDEGLRDDAVRQVLIDPHHPGVVYAGTDSGLWRANLGTGLPAGHRRAIEFYHAGFDHYFVSADRDEIGGLDAGVFAGWVRTGEGFRVAEANAPATQPACRFFGTGFGTISSHFYTPYPGECENVKADPNWQYEKIAFGLALPDAASLACPPDTRPLYRAWNRNQGGAPNHRYNTDLWSMVLSVLRQGWILEGEEETLVFACVPVE